MEELLVVLFEIFCFVGFEGLVAVKILRFGMQDIVNCYDFLNCM